MTTIERPEIETAPTPRPSAPQAPASAPPSDARGAWWNRALPGRPTAGGAQRPPRSFAVPIDEEPLPPVLVAVRRGLIIAGVVILAIVVNLAIISQLSYAVWQQQRYDDFRDELALATAPVGEVDIDNRLLEPGAPVAHLKIPSINLETVVVEGSGGGETIFGPGHRRDTVLPGQTGTSVIYGRAAAYGGPFGRIDQLAPGETFTITTAQGTHEYRVLGLRYAGDPGPPPPAAGESRLVFVTARGPAFVPTGVVRVDAALTSKAFDAGPRVTVPASLPAGAQPMATDTSTVWALVLWLQALLLVEIAAFWCARRWGQRQTWLVFSILGFAVALRVADEITKLLPNLL